MESPNIRLKAMDRYKGAKVLVVDDNQDLLKLIKLRLKPMEFELVCTDSGEAALSILEHFSADLIITDLKMPGMSGVELFERIHHQNPVTPVIILTAHGTIPEAVEATQAGVAAYLSKPFESTNLVETIYSALHSSGFLKQAPSTTPSFFKLPPSMVYKSAAMSALMSLARTYASSDNLLLIEGEPGTGKDQFAQLLHQLSDRKDQPMLQISCGALPRTVLRDEVFGLVGKGSEDNPEKPGLLKQAHNGTLVFSDYEEANDDLMQQSLTAASEKYVTHIDGGRRHRNNVRIIATTNLKVQHNPRTKRIWTLAQTLNATILSIPSLSERPEDIPLIANHYLNTVLEKKTLQFSTKAMQALLQADWVGNTRHLMNVVQQCARLTTTNVISEALVRSRINSPQFKIPPLSKAQRDFERDYLSNILKVTNGNVTKASEIAQRNRTELHRLLKKHRIEAQSFRAN